MTETELLTGLIQREQEALAGLIDLYAAPVYALVARILSGVGTDQDVEECCSDAFYAAWEQAGRYQPERASLRTWLLMIAKYQGLEYRRKLLRQQGKALDDQGAEREMPDQRPTPEMAVVAADERRRVMDALAALSPLDKQLVYRRYFLYENVDRLAADMGLTRQAADNRLWRARKVLRGLLGPNSGEEAVGSVK